MRILYIAWSNQPPQEIYGDPSVWYRCFQPAQALRELSLNANVVDYRCVSEEVIKSHDCIVFFRPQYSRSFVELVNCCEKNNLRYIASYDDLFFDIGYLRDSGFRKLGAPQEQILGNRPELYAKAFYFFDEFISSTDGLKKAILKHKPLAKVSLHYNGIPPEMHEWVKLKTTSRKKNNRRIGYFAGGAIHTPDLLKITPALEQVMAEQDAVFYCVETVQIPQSLRASGKIETTPRMNYSKMLEAYSNCNITVAPLELNDFTNSKSGIKFLESALHGNSVVATPIDDILRVGNDLLFTAVSEDDWYHQLTKALTTEFTPAHLKNSFEDLIYRHSTLAEARNFITEFNHKAN